MLVHFDSNIRLYAHLDSSKKGIGAMIYHSAADPPTQEIVKPIMFLSKNWKSAELHYWPTEIEIAGLCWVVQKIRHLIEASKYPTIIYTDHSAATQIATQSSMTTTSLVRMNMRNVCSSEFLNRFRLDVRHKSGKTNTVSDALSRLESFNKHDLSSTVAQTLAYPVAVLEVSPEFILKLVDAYRNDSKCLNTLETLKANEGLEQNAAYLPFETNNGII